MRSTVAALHPIMRATSSVKSTRRSSIDFRRCFDFFDGRTAPTLLCSSTAEPVRVASSPNARGSRGPCKRTAAARLRGAVTAAPPGSVETCSPRAPLPGATTPHKAGALRALSWLQHFAATRRRVGRHRMRRRLSRPSASAASLLHPRDLVDGLDNRDTDAGPAQFLPALGAVRLQVDAIARSANCRPA